MATRNIPFHNSMQINKRNEEFAYLRLNCYDSHASGLYPSHDFVESEPTLPGTHRVRFVIGDEQMTNKKRVFVHDGINLNMYNLGDSVLKGSILGADFVSGAIGNDGIHLVVDTNQIFKVDQDANTVTLIGNLPSRATRTVFDGLHYYYVLDNGQIYRQIDSGAVELAFTQLPNPMEFVTEYRDDLAMAAQVGSDIYVYIWGKESNTLFNKRVRIRNSRLIALAEVEDTLLLIRSIGNTQNSKEKQGEVITDAYNGSGFTYLNSIKTGDDDLVFESVDAFDVGNRFLVVALNSGRVTGQKTQIYEDWVLKIWANGRMETIYENGDSIDTIHVAYSHIIMSSNETLLINTSVQDDYDKYDDFTTTKYITNFMDDPMERYTLEYVGFTWEKTHRDATNEEVTISYRFSEHDPFIALATITSANVYEFIDQNMDQAIKDAEYNDQGNLTGSFEHQIFHCRLDPQDINLHREYNEVQFMFEPKYGASIIKAWYDRDIITRNTHR